MKVKYIKLITPIKEILMEGTQEEVKEEEIDEMLKAWDDILNKSSYFKFSVGNKGYFLPANVLKNSIVEVDLEGEDNG